MIKDEIIKTINNKYNNSATNNILICPDDFRSINVETKEAARILFILNDENLIDIKTTYNYQDITFPLNIVVHSECVNYFNNKNKFIKQSRRENRNEIREWTALIISILALIISVLSLYISYQSTQVKDPSNENDITLESET